MERVYLSDLDLPLIAGGRNVVLGCPLLALLCVYLSWGLALLLLFLIVREGRLVYYPSFHWLVVEDEGRAVAISERSSGGTGQQREKASETVGDGGYCLFSLFI